MVFGVHCLPVRSDEAAPDTSANLFFSLAIWLTASGPAARQAAAKGPQASGAAIPNRYAA